MKEWGTQLGVHLEKPSKERFIAGTLGAAAMLLSMDWAAKKYLPRITTSARGFLEQINVIENNPHSQTIQLFSSLAESFGVTVDESHMTYWRSVLTASRALDTVIDEGNPENIDQETLALICGQPIDGMSPSDAEKFSSTLHNASEERREILLNGLQISDFAKKIQETKDVDKLIDLRQEEAAVYAAVMTLDNPAEDPAITAFNEWLVGLSKAGYQLDTLIDMAKDYKEKVTAVKPTPTAYLAVAKQTLQESRLMLAELPKSALPHLAATGARKMARGILRHYNASGEIVE